MNSVKTNKNYTASFSSELYYSPINWLPNLTDVIFIFQSSIIKISSSNLNIESDRKITSFYLFCYFGENVPTGSLFELLDSSNSVIDSISVNPTTTILEPGNGTSVLMFDLTKYIQTHRTSASFGDIYLKATLLPNISAPNSLLTFYKYSTFASGEVNEDAQYYSLTFLDVDGLCDSCSYQTFGLGVSGETKVKLFDGSLYFLTPLLIGNLAKTSASLSLCYNGNSITDDYGFGFGWNLTFRYSLTINSPLNEIILTDFTGQKKKFNRLRQSDKEAPHFTLDEYTYYCYADGSYIYKDNFFSNKYYYITPDNTKITFVLSSLLGDKFIIDTIETANGELFEFTYNSLSILGINIITKIVSPDDEIEFNYGENNPYHLQSIVSKKKYIETEFTYVGNLLTNIDTYKKDSAPFSNVQGYIRTLIRSTYFTYDSSSRLLSVTNDSEKVMLAFNYQSGKITSVVERPTISLNGFTINDKTTRFLYGEEYSKVTTCDNKVRYYHFDRYGATLSVLDNNGLAYNYQYGYLTSHDEENNCHALMSSNIVAVEMKNLVSNGSFENSGTPTSGWQKNTENSSCTYQYKANSLYDGSYLLITNNHNSLDSILSQHISVSDGGSYSFSTLYKMISGSGDECYFKITVQYYEDVYVSGPGSTGGTIQHVLRTDVYELPMVEGSDEWRFVDKNNITVPDSSDVTIEIITCPNYSIAVDEVVFARSNRKGERNYVRNSNFEVLDNSMPSNWTVASGSNFNVVSASSVGQGATHDNLFYDYVLHCLSSSTPKDNVISQQILISGDAGDSISFGVWYKGYLRLSEHAAVLVQIHNANIQTNSTKDFVLLANNNLDSWQLISGTIVTDFPYDKVTIKLVHYGMNQCYFEGAFLYKDYSSTRLDYNQNGSVTSLSENRLFTRVNTNNKGQKIAEKNKKDEYISYKYDSNGKLVQVVDSLGSVLNFTNSEHGTVRRVTNNDGAYIETEETSSNGLLIKKDQFGYESRDVFDCFGNKVAYIDSNGTAIRKEFNTDFRPTLVERATIDGKSCQTHISYNHYGCPTSITAPNGDVYTFDYDDYGRMLSAYMNGVEVEDRTYSPAYSSSFNRPISETVTGNSTYTSSYSLRKDLVVGTYLNNQEQYHFRYDSFSRLSAWRRILNDEEGFIFYDGNNKVISEINSKGQKYYLQRDSLDNVQQETINIGSVELFSDFIHDYEFNDKCRSPFFYKLEHKYNFDVVYFGQSTSGDYGLTPINSDHEIEYDNSLHGDVLKLNHNTSPIIYDLSSTNSLKSSSFDFETWDTNYRNRKVFIGILNVGESSSTKPVIAFYDDNSEEILAIFISGNHECKVRHDNTISTQTNSSVNLLNNWLSIQFSLVHESTGTTIHLFINNVDFCSVTNSSITVNQIKQMSIGGNITDSASNNVSLIYFAITASAAFKTLSTWLLNDHINFINSYNINHLKYAGVHNNYTSNIDVDFITLNGTFKSYRGLLPSYFTYNMDEISSKSDLFVWDNTLKRHVYHSQRNGSPCLMYNFSSSQNIKIKVDFSLNANHSGYANRTIIAFADWSYGVRVFWFSVVAKSTGIYFIYNNNEQLISALNSSEWNSIYVQASFPNVTIQYNNSTPQTFNVGSFTHGYYVNFGYSIHNVVATTPTNFLNGRLKDIVFTKNSALSLSDLAIQKDLFVKTFDSFGRKINVNATNYQKTISYEQPVDDEGDPIPNRTSTRVCQESDSLNNTISYEYDGVGNIVKRTINNQETIYAYDYAHRLIASETSTDSKEYFYDDNGNIQSIISDDGNNTCVRDFAYDSQTNRLASITENNVTINYGYSSQYALYPTSIGNISLNWRGKLLHQVTVNNTNYLYEYDYQNRRIEKISNNSVTKYFYDHSNLIAEKTGATTIIYKYDESNILYGFDVVTSSTRESYLYLKDELGIINGVLNGSGTQVVAYTYDDFGRVLSSIGNSTLINLNHILYKDYYYDNETGFYLLGKRYYYPYSCRFISPDDVDYLIANNIDKCQFNLFSYCDNNPILYSDPSGHFILLGLFIAAIALTATAVITVGTLTLLTVYGLHGIATVAAIIDAQQHGNNVIEQVIQVNRALFILEKNALHFGIVYVEGQITQDDDKITESTEYFFKTFPYELRVVLQTTFIGLIAISDLARNALMYFGQSIVTIIGFFDPLLGIAANFGLNWFYSTTIDKCEENYERNVLEWSSILTNSDHYDIINYLFASLPRFPDKPFIDKQNHDALENIKFGFSNIKESGCGIIATYNALLALNKITANDFPKMILYFEQKNLFFGHLGALPSHMFEILDGTFGLSNQIQITNDAFDIVGNNSVLNVVNQEYILISTFFNYSLDETLLRSIPEEWKEKYRHALTMHSVCALFHERVDNNNKYYLLNNTCNIRYYYNMFYDCSCDDYEVFETGLLIEVLDDENS